jgi:hypothetical protein
MQGIIAAGKYRFDEGQTLPPFREFLKKRGPIWTCPNNFSPFLFKILRKPSPDSFSIQVMWLIQ